jgi:hypothetical protein
LDYDVICYDPDCYLPTNSKLAHQLCVGLYLC